MPRERCSSGRPLSVGGREWVREALKVQRFAVRAVDPVELGRYPYRCWRYQSGLQ
jgi:hypothetical protein